MSPSRERRTPYQRRKLVFSMCKSDSEPELHETSRVILKMGIDGEEWVSGRVEVEKPCYGAEFSMSSFFASA